MPGVVMLNKQINYSNSTKLPKNSHYVNFVILFYALCGGDYKLGYFMIIGPGKWRF